MCPDGVIEGVEPESTLFDLLPLVEPSYAFREPLFSSFVFFECCSSRVSRSDGGLAESGEDRSFGLFRVGNTLLGNCEDWFELV